MNKLNNEKSNLPFDGQRHFADHQGVRCDKSDSSVGWFCHQVQVVLEHRTLGHDTVGICLALAALACHSIRWSRQRVQNILLRDDISPALLGLFLADAERIKKRID